MSCWGITAIHQIPKNQNNYFPWLTENKAEGLCYIVWGLLRLSLLQRKHFKHPHMDSPSAMYDLHWYTRPVASVVTRHRKVATVGRCDPTSCLGGEGPEKIFKVIFKDNSTSIYGVKWIAKGPQKEQREKLLLLYCLPISVTRKFQPLIRAQSLKLVNLVGRL